MPIVRMSEMPTDQSGSELPLVMQFAKWPEAGKVKTRLIPRLGMQGALAAHCTLTLAVLGNLQAAGLPLQLWWDCERRPPLEAANVMSVLQQQSVAQRFQCVGPLGERMAAALADALKSHTCAMIVGSDCPSVDADYVRQAAEKLTHCDVVLGPAEDGGYVLIGARAVVPGMLDGIEWGGAQVLQQTCERLRELKLSFELMAMRWDVDEPEDWQRFQRDLLR